MTLHTEFASRLADAIRAYAPLPLFTPQLSLQEAYDLQRKVTEIRCGDRIGGVKAGVTSPLAQGFFKIDHALIGSLYEDAKLPAGAVLEAREGRNIECELAVIVDEKGAPKAIAPAIEIVFVKFSDPSDMTASNLVACNLGADAYIVGDVVPWDPVFNDIEVRLTRNGSVINQARMREALDGPENAAAWMWREAQNRGLSVSENTLFLTGACGAVVPADIGQYEVDFGALGSVSFSVEAAA